MCVSAVTQGNATCSSEQRGEAEKFTIQYHPDGSGRWAIRNRPSGYYFGGTDDMIQCYEKQAGPSEWWFVRLAIHPQVGASHRRGGRCLPHIHCWRWLFTDGNRLIQ